jgi:branched-chain amino acid transport system ATP-binding protein
VNPQRKVGEVVLDVDNISLAFGGVKAIQEVSFDVREGEVRAIIGPNGAGKSSMLNCINGFYHPQHGTITYKGVKRARMRTHDAAAQGVARTFQNIALFRGMTTLDNIDRAQSEDEIKLLLAGLAHRPGACRRAQAPRGS